MQVMLAIPNKQRCFFAHAVHLTPKRHGKSRCFGAKMMYLKHNGFVVFLHPTQRKHRGKNVGCLAKSLIPKADSLKNWWLNDGNV